VSVESAIEVLTSGCVDVVTAAALRKNFLELARTEGKTTVLVTHQLEEAIEMGGRILVFGKPARLLADIRLRGSSTGEIPRLRSEIQRLIQANEPGAKTGRGDVA